MATRLPGGLARRIVGPQPGRRVAFRWEKDVNLITLGKELISVGRWPKRPGSNSTPLTPVEEGLKEVDVAGPGQQLAGPIRLDPPNLVYLVVGAEPAGLDLHGPVRDLLHLVPTDRVPHLADPTLKPTAIAGLLLDLPQRGLLELLPGILLALGETPIVIGRPMHDQYFNAAFPLAVDESTPGPDVDILLL